MRTQVILVAVSVLLLSYTGYRNLVGLYSGSSVSLIIKVYKVGTQVILVAVSVLLLRYTVYRNLVGLYSGSCVSLIIKVYSL